MGRATCISVELYKFNRISIRALRVEDDLNKRCNRTRDKFLPTPPKGSDRFGL